ncbi:MAG TPA: LLM class flavin-dependent oxidoreductase [Acidimicrobiales bacterium]|jgi:alkanesulfonate monooxygenase SsuD/methylene tetrahydromethanopterin reductase-like flavin-dependent oxidoreductase (luciferase family)|nr:LLM class flavin-dependent oxidoreductase [Acidimicrobiales bacterium]
MRVCLMIEGQEDVTWDQWVALARACEDAGLEGLFRSDHYLSVMGQAGRGSLDAWATLAALAPLTNRIRLGTLVSPATFRHPSVVAKMAVTVDHVSGGRVELGLGAGWLEAEHRAYGFPAPSFDVFAEQLEIVHRSWGPGPFDFHGRHYRVEGLDALPKGVQRPHPWLIVGGHAGARGAALAARWGDEYNTTFASPDTCRQRRAVVEEAWEKEGRPPDTLVFSLMTRGIVGRDAAECRQRVQAAMARTGDTGDPVTWLADHQAEWAVGTVDAVADKLRQFEAAGVERVMLQHLAHDDLAMVALLGEVARLVA